MRDILFREILRVPAPTRKTQIKSAVSVSSLLNECRRKVAIREECRRVVKLTTIPEVIEKEDYVHITNTYLVFM